MKLTWSRLETTTPVSSRKCLNHYATRADGNTAITVIGQALDTKKRRDFSADKSDHHVIIHFPYLDRVFVLSIPTL